MLDFAKLAQDSVGRSTIFKGLFPPFMTLLTLLGVALSIAGALWLWTLFTAGALAHATAFLPLFGETFLAVLGFSILNFWFNREITTFMLSSREVCEGFVFDKENPTDLRKMVNHLRQEVNAHFKKIYGKDHVDLPMPRLCTFTDPNFKIVTVEGRDYDNAALFISSGSFNSHDTNMSQRQIAALIQVELVKIYLRRGYARTVVGLGTDLGSTLQNMNPGGFMGKIFGYLTGLQFFSLLDNGVKRTHEYEAIAEVIKMGRGFDLIEAIDSGVCPTLAVMPTKAELDEAQKKNQRKPYDGPFKFFLKPIADFIDNNEYAGDPKRGYRFFSLLSILVRETGYYVKELFSPSPRATSRKNYIRPEIKDEVSGREINLKTAKTGELDLIRVSQLKRNQALNIPLEDRYTPIDTFGTGWVAPLADNRLKQTPQAMKYLGSDSSKAILHQQANAAVRTQIPLEDRNQDLNSSCRRASAPAA